MFSNLSGKIDDLIWGSRLRGKGRPGFLLSGLLRYLYGLTRDVLSGQLTLRAMSLVYTTLLSVVPLIAFSFSVLKGFGVHEQLSPYLYDFLAPLGDQGKAIGDQMMSFVSNVKGGLLGGVSLAFFIYTAISMVQKVEESFNYVWYVSKPRSFARRFADYAIVLLIGPLAMVVAIGIYASIKSNEITRWLTDTAVVSPFVDTFGTLAPYLLVSGVFAFLYKYMPNTNVKLSAAIVGGLAGGFIWASMGAFFTSFVVNAARIQLVYSGFAVAITALIWLYLNWLVLLIGAQIAFYFQKPAFLRIGRREPQLSNAVRERIALNVMYSVGAAFRDPGHSVTVAAISSQIKIPVLALSPIINELEQSGLLITTERESLMPGRDLAQISLHDIVSVVRAGGATGSYRDPSWSSNIDSLAARMDEAIANTLGSTTLSEILQQDAADDRQARPESGAGDSHVVDQ